MTYLHISHIYTLFPTVPNIFFHTNELIVNHLWECFTWNIWRAYRCCSGSRISTKVFVDTPFYRWFVFLSHFAIVERQSSIPLHSTSGRVYFIFRQSTTLLLRICSYYPCQGQRERTRFFLFFLKTLVPHKIDKTSPGGFVFYIPI